MCEQRKLYFIITLEERLLLIELIFLANNFFVKGIIIDLK